MLVPQRDPAALAAAIAGLVGDSGLCQEMGHRGARRVAQDFDEGASAGELMRLFGEP